jgi:hypothetical protein
MSESLIIEQLLPECDAVRREHLVVSGSREQVFEAARQADFLDAARDSHLVRFLFGARSLAQHAVAAVSRTDFEEPPAPERLRLTELPRHGDWVLLGENPPEEIAFGAIGRFWAGETAWEQIDAADFQSFDKPGFAKIACDFSLRSYGADHTLVTYECRTLGTDPKSTKAFLRYWRPLSPAIGVVLRSQLAVIAKQRRDQESFSGR